MIISEKQDFGFHSVEVSYDIRVPSNNNNKKKNSKYSNCERQHKGESRKPSFIPLSANALKAMS